MALDPPKRIERSVDSLQKIYAVVIALAIGHGMQTLLIDRATGAMADTPELLVRAPTFLALVFTLVPFYHGMNRHLDFCYIERKQGQQAKGALLFDFLVFFLESALLFAAANSIGAGMRAFAALGLLLAVDVVWALISHWIHYGGIKPSVARWSGINAVVLVIGLFVGLRQDYSEPAKAELLLVLALVRSGVDYWACWPFYFPDGSTDAE